MSSKRNTPSLTYKLLFLIHGLSKEIVFGIVSLLPNDFISTNIRYFVYLIYGIDIKKKALVYRNVLLLGRISIGEYSSISNNTTISGGTVGVHIGSYVMIAPGCCIVAFDHGTEANSIPMIQQPLVEEKIVIQDDVWIAANCTITKGVTIGTGAIVGANSVVTRDVLPFEIVAGAPAKKIGSRK